MSDLLIPCTGCCDCIPCPVGIVIPEVFKIYNGLPANGLENTKFLYDRLHKKADDCLRCGRCEKLCSQKIGISSMMFEIAEEME
ncbi:MAG: 4Fe-4S dicluster domain-containing protein [Lachnospiraceae bacterium]|nr:4Fe-4S dicluster domain-containing protein [Lachnospiraceae bacterium]